MGRVIFVTSFKGGVGKTTVTAGLAITLSKIGYKVLLIDGDFGMRCMDMVLGLQNSVVYNVYDVLTGLCKPEDAVVTHESGLDFIAAPMGEFDATLPKTEFFRLFSELREKYDYVFIDSSAEKSEYYLSFAAAADDGIIVAMHRSVAVRAAEKTAYTLSGLGFRNIRLVVNCYDEKCAEDGTLPDLYQIIKRSAVRLIGVIPVDFKLVEWQEKGEAVFCTDEKYLSLAEKAFYNTALRVAGYSVELLDGVYGRRRTKRKKFTCKKERNKWTLQS